MPRIPLDMTSLTLDDFRRVLEGFDIVEPLATMEPVSGGHINDSWLMRLEGGQGLFLQRINHEVYPDPVLLMQNVVSVSQHVRRQLRERGVDDLGRRCLRVLPTREGDPLLEDWVTGEVWRLFDAVEGTHVLERVENAGQARASAAAFGAFFAALNADGGVQLGEVIPHFHDTPLRYDALSRAVADDVRGRVAGCRAELDALLERRERAGLIVELQEAGELPERSVHNDPKCTNVLLDDATGEALCVVDLDNAMPGTSLHDVGDMLRAMTSLSAEDEPDLDQVACRPELFEAVVEGWLTEAGPMLAPAEVIMIVTAGWTITLEQAVRFLTDHLQGDGYYKTAREGHNLDRARAQLRLVESMEAQRTVLEGLVRDVWTRLGRPRQA